MNCGAVVVVVILCVLLMPGLLFQVPGGNFKTSGASILVHSLLYFGLICLFLISIKIYFYIS
uniref:Transmembrane protein n=1 Tax=Cajanus cajan TaxID=3821 RepID=A0A151SEI4_CAJCA|nr:hypothetical protein KK1_024922 [Cajanus cajan]